MVGQALLQALYMSQRTPEAPALTELAAQQGQKGQKMMSSPSSTHDVKVFSSRKLRSQSKEEWRDGWSGVGSPKR